MIIKVEIQTGDALTFQADVLALKYAQGLHGLDRAVFEKLSKHGQGKEFELPAVGEAAFVRAPGALGCPAVLFLGTNQLWWKFEYEDIRAFAARVLQYLAERAPDTKHICLTLHGVEFGLDETEAFKSEIAGLVDAISNDQYPPDLQRITIMEIKEDRVQRLDALLKRILPQGVIVTPGEELDPSFSFETTPAGSTELKMVGDLKTELATVGTAEKVRPSIFVAMPFAKKFTDVFHYGISGAAEKADYRCERADFETFTGDIMDWVKKRIREADLVIADLTGANPNVYLEVGYAWACDKPTLLLIQDPAELKFDVKGERCLVYEIISELEEQLKKDLENLRPTFTGGTT